MTQKRMTHRASEPVTLAGQGGQGLQSFKITSVGTPDHVLFSALGLPDMADTNYRVITDGETVLVTHVDESTIATTGFDILHGGAAEIIHVFVHGRIAGTPQV
jgi:hypothetical protein